MAMEMEEETKKKGDKEKGIETREREKKREEK